MKVKREEAGFTLVEMMVVLMVISIIATLSITLFVPVYKQMIINHFLKEFERDILYAQTYAMSHNSAVSVLFDDEKSKYYLSNSALNEIVQTRHYNSKIEIECVSFPSRIIFLSNGNIRQAGKLYIHFDGTVYAVIFSIGKGRFYVKKL